MATKKGGGTVDNFSKPQPKYRCVKVGDGEKVHAGSILVTQLGTVFHPGKNTYLGRNFAIHAKKDGTVKFSRGFKGKKFININLKEDN